MFLWTVFGVTMVVLLTILAWVLSLIPDPSLKLMVTKSRKDLAKGSSKKLIPGDMDGDGVLSAEEMRIQLESVAEALKIPLSQVRGYWESFSLYDIDGSGSVDAKELNNMLIDSIGHKLEDSEIRQIILDVDADGSGTVEFGEFCVLAKRLDMGEQSPEELYEAFMLWSDGKDHIPGEVMRKAMTELGERLSPEECDEFMAAVDTDNDGTIDYQEFVRAMAWQHQRFEEAEPASP